MCTLMQKDVLIEAVAGTIAMLVKCNPVTEDKRKQKEYNLIELSEMRDFLYSSSVEKISFNELSLKIKNIRSDFNNQPLKCMS